LEVGELAHGEAGWDLTVFSILLKGEPRWRDEHQPVPHDT